MRKVTEHFPGPVLPLSLSEMNAVATDKIHKCKAHRALLLSAASTSNLVLKEDREQGRWGWYREDTWEGGGSGSSRGLGTRPSVVDEQSSCGERKMAQESVKKKGRRGDALKVFSLVPSTCLAKLQANIIYSRILYRQYFRKLYFVDWGEGVARRQRPTG